MQTHAKVNQDSDEDSNFSTIQLLYVLMGIMQLVIMPLFGMLGGWISLAVKKIVKKYTKGYENYRSLLFRLNLYEFYSKIVILVFIMFFYISAMVQLDNYCEETFNSSAIAIVHIVIFVITILLTIPVVLLFNCFNNDDDKDDDESNVHCMFQHCNFFATIMICICLGYFFPYMVIAFIQHPLQSGFAYIVLFLLTISLSLIQIFWLIAKAPIIEGYAEKITLMSTVFLIVVALPYVLMLLITLFTLGSFSDFDDLKNIILPLFTSFIASSVGIGIFCARRQIDS